MLYGDQLLSLYQELACENAQDYKSDRKCVSIE